MFFRSYNVPLALERTGRIGHILERLQEHVMLLLVESGHELGRLVAERLHGSVVAEALLRFVRVGVVGDTGDVAVVGGEAPAVDVLGPVEADQPLHGALAAGLGFLAHLAARLQRVRVVLDAWRRVQRAQEQLEDWRPGNK